MSPAFEVLLGGAAGVGKSFWLHKRPLQHIHNKNFKAIIFRKTTDELQELKDYSLDIIPKIDPGAYLRHKGECLIWHFSSGARYFFWHMNKPEDFRKHDGKSYTMILFDEIQSFTEEEYTYLFSRCRTTDPALKGLCRVFSSGMPEGKHCAWVYKRFIQPGPYKIHHHTIEIAGKKYTSTRQFIPGTLEDNPILMKNDPDYEIRLAQGGEERFHRLRFGDWTKPKGAYFSELDIRTHGATPHRPPEGTYCWVTMDWGNAKPYSVGWYYENCDGDIIRFQELYGGEPGRDTGNQRPVRYVAQDIKDMSADLDIGCYIGDPAIWGKDADDINSVGEKFQREGIYWQRAKNDRIQGWNEVKNRISTYGNRRPTVFVTTDCVAFWSIMTTLPHDKNRWEDLDTRSEDH